jgi:hypothetical protein
MFRLLRTLILVMIAFVAGVLYERNNARETCAAGGGLWLLDICIGPEYTND